MPSVATTVHAEVLAFAKDHVDFISEELASSGRSHLAGLILRLPENAARVLDVSRAANARDAAALSATFAAAAATADPAACVRYADIAMVFGGETVAEKLLPLVAAVNGRVERGGENLPTAFPGEAGGTGANAGKQLFWKGEVAGEAAEGLSVERFREEYFAGDVPVRIVGAAQSDDWSALQKWRDPKYLCRVLGHRTVPVEIGGTEEFVAFREVLTAMVSKSESDVGAEEQECMYLAQHPLFDYVEELRSDFSPPKWTRAAGNPDGSGLSLLVNAWIGGSGTGTKLHFDSRDNILVQVVGSKSVTLFPPSDSKHLYVGNGNNFSPCKIDAPDYSAHPNLKSATGTTCTLREGDALFIPAGVWHFVRTPWSFVCK